MCHIFEWIVSNSVLSLSYMLLQSINKVGYHSKDSLAQYEKYQIKR